MKRAVLAMVVVGDAAAMLALLLLLLLADPPWRSYANPVLAGAQQGGPSVCFNNCSGHGACRNYQCHCFPGYHGSDCSFSYMAYQGEHPLVPILGAGHFNISSKRELLAIKSKHPLILVGFSSRSCHKCITVESEYQVAATLIMDQFKVPLARVDVGTRGGHQLAEECQASDMPSLALWSRGSWFNYEGLHTAGAIVEYVRKQAQPGDGVLPLASVPQVQAFLSRDLRGLGLGIEEVPQHATMVVGVFSDPDLEEDDVDDYREAAKRLKSREGVYFGLVTDSTTSSHLKRAKLIDRTPSLMAQAAWMDTPAAVNLDELYGDGATIDAWIFRSTVPLVGELSGRTSKSYEELGLPMLIMFLDLSHLDGPDQHHSRDSPGSCIGGETGGVPNHRLLEEFRVVATDHVGRISFVYADGVALEAHMRSLGLYGGKERLPSIAFNLRDRRQVPFPEDLPINRETLAQFCADFLSGRLHNAEDAKAAARKALQSARPVSTVNMAHRKPVREAAPEVPGVSERYESMRPVVAVNSTSFRQVVLDESKDVMVVFHAQGCEACGHLAPYIRKMAERFHDLSIPSLVVARMDVSHDFPPAELGLTIKTLPTIMFFPANAKTPPYRFFSGPAKSLALMLWAQQEASIQFTLPDLPHLSEAERELYKTQVYQREMAARGRT